jgi:alpha-galactosidase
MSPTVSNSPSPGPSIRYVQDRNLWILETQNTSYAIGINESRQLEHLYWGAKLPFDSDYPAPNTLRVGAPEARSDAVNLEYPAWGGLIYSEPCLKAAFADGVRDLILNFATEETPSANELIITLRDPHYEIAVRLHYIVHFDFDLIERYAEITNESSDSIRLDSVQSATWSFPGNERYRLTHLAGKWSAETQVQRSMLDAGRKVLESRRGMTSLQANPWFALDHGAATEEHGKVWFGALAWSGNWKFTAEVTPWHQVRLTGGLNDFDFTWLLPAGGTFKTPSFTAGFTNAGFGQASRNMHRYQQVVILPKPHASALRKVIYNSWEATHFDVNEEDQARLAEKAAALGVELFVMDDGWFGKRKDDHAGLGDWFPAPDKFPNGLGGLIERVKALGMDFGIWVEPEMVNPDSDLYRAHPDWVLHFPNRPRSELRFQLVLNLARQDVQDYISGFLHKLLSDHAIDYIKWDMNRPFSEPGWPELPPERQQEMWVRYVEGLYSIFDKLRAAFPNVVFESCASGGGRVDHGILQRTDLAWASDNTNALDRLAIQEGYSFAYSPGTMSCWVTDSWNHLLPLSYRFHTSMMGVLGIGGNLHKWSEDDQKIAKEMIATYKKIRPLVQKGLLYRLMSPRTDPYTAVQYVSEDRKASVLFLSATHRAPASLWPDVNLRGLDPEVRYQINETDQVRSGQSLMNHGIRTELWGFFTSQLITFKAV